MNKTVAAVLQWLVILTMPFFLGFSAIETFVNGAELYVTYEYGKPGFPRDLQQVDPFTQAQLGLEPLTQEQREELALVAVNYLQRPQPAEEVIFMLEEQRLPGADQPLYNEAEIGHMIDVKHVTDGIARLNWVAALIVLGGLALLLARSETRSLGYQALFRGGVATVLVLLFIGLFIVLAWSVFFVQFHELLFPPGTWTFAYSDSLIRLFPEQFWFDFGVLLSGFALLLGVAVTILGAYLRRSRPGV
ncbi:MAG: TIGR01906 family membrane protein [Chloroflexota bacterium]